MNWRELKEETAIAMADPRVGDCFTEHYCFWLHVVGRSGDEVSFVEASAPCELPKDGKLSILLLLDFQKRFRYEHADGYWIKLHKRGTDVSGWLEQLNVAASV